MVKRNQIVKVNNGFDPVYWHHLSVEQYTEDYYNGSDSPLITANENAPSLLNNKLALLTSKSHGEPYGHLIDVVQIGRHADPYAKIEKNGFSCSCYRRVSNT